MHQPKKLLAVMLETWEHEGGIQQVNRSLIRFFAKQTDWDEIVVLVMLDSQSTIDAALADQPVPSHMRVYGFSANKASFYLAIIRFVIVNRPQLVYLAHIYLAGWGLLNQLLGIKYFFMVYGIDAWQPLPLLKKLGVKLAAAGLSISRHTRTTAMEFEQAFEKLMICPLGRDVDTTIHNLIVHQQLGRNFAHRKVILIVGRIDAQESYKGHNELLAAVEQLRVKHPGLLLVIVGRGSGLPLLEQQVASMGLAPWVHFAGYVPDDELSIYYALCDVFAMPSRREGFGLVYVEAMAHQKPCIGGKFDSAGEIIVEGETGFLVDPANSAELVDYLDRLLSDATLREEMGLAGQQRYHRLFTECRFHQRFQTFVEQISRD